MTGADDVQALESELAETIQAMQKIQTDSKHSGQPMSGSELERLKRLGMRYEEVLAKMGAVE